MLSAPSFSDFLPKRPVPGKTPFPLLVLLLAAFLGQVILQSVSLPHETPRSAIERLTGIDIAPLVTSDFSIHDPMMMSRAEHPHMVMKNKRVSPPINGHHHHGDDACPLCPLLGHIFLALSYTIMVLSNCQLISTRWARPAQPRAPPLRGEWQFPPSRAPPVSF